MSRLEVDAKPILTDICFLDVKELNRKEAEILAKWLFLKFCVIAESGRMHCVSEDNRRLFMNKGEIPRHFSAWCFYHNVDIWKDRNKRNSSRAKSAKFNPDLNEPHNISTYTRLWKYSVLYDISMGCAIANSFCQRVRD
jgi:hypothetical protein